MLDYLGRVLNGLRRLWLWLNMLFDRGLMDHFVQLIRRDHANLYSLQWLCNVLALPQGKGDDGDDN